MKRQLIILLLLLVGGLAVAAQTSPRPRQVGLPATPAVAPVTVEAVDRLELQVAYDQVVKAQQQVTIAQQALEKRFTAAQVKYKIDEGWGYNFTTGVFDPPKKPEGRP